VEDRDQGAGQRGARDRGRRVDAARLDEGGARDHQPPGEPDRGLAEPARHQRERRRRIGPAEREPGEADADQARAAAPGEPQPERHDRSEQRRRERRHRTLVEHAVLDEAAAAGERGDAIDVDRVATEPRVVHVVEHVGARVRRERTGERRRRLGQARCGTPVDRGDRADEHGHRGHGEEARAGRGEPGRRAARAMRRPRRAALRGRPAGVPRGHALTCRA
jgi:hypothetical protein